MARGAVRLLKLARLLRLAPMFAALQKELRLALLRPLKVGVGVALVCHTLAAAWRASMRADDAEVDAAASWSDLYVQDAYWVIMTMTTVGYGDISPTGTCSRLYAVLAMIISSIFFGTVLSALTHATRGLFEDAVEERVASATGFMERRRLPVVIQRRVQNNLRHQLRDERLKVMDPELFALLSPSMQRELSLALLSSTVLQFPLFRGVQHSFVAELAQAHCWMQCLPGDLVAEEGQLVQEVTFVIHGRLVMQLAAPGDEGEAKDAEVETGAWFGEDCLFNDGCVRNSTVVAVVESELAVLTSGDYRRIVEKYPRLLEKHQIIQEALAKGILAIGELDYRNHQPQPYRRFRTTGRSTIFGLTGSKKTFPDFTGAVCKT